MPRNEPGIYYGFHKGVHNGTVELFDDFMPIPERAFFELYMQRIDTKEAALMAEFDAL